MKKQFILCCVATAMLFSFNSCKTENEPSNETQLVLFTDVCRQLLDLSTFHDGFFGN